MDGVKSKPRFKEVNYTDFVTELEKQYRAFQKLHDKNEVEIAVAIDTGYMSVRNCLAKTTQMVSDKLLTTLMNHIGMDGKVEWYRGERKYHIEK